MNAVPQIITTEKGEELVVLPRRAYDALLARAGDLAAEDRMTARLVAEARGQPRLPAWLGEAIARGDHPVKAARKQAGKTQLELARAAGLGQAYLSEIESGKKSGVEVLAKIAAVLEIDPEWLKED